MKRRGGWWSGNSDSLQTVTVSLTVLALMALISACGMEKNVGTGTMGSNQASLASPMMAESGDAAGAAPALRRADGAMPAASSLPSGDASPAVDAARAAAQPAGIRRMIITTGTMTVEVDQFDEARDKLNAAVTELGGFASGSSASVDQAGHRYGSLTVRIPSGKYADLVTRARGLGKVKNESATGQDVTEEYTDIDARLRAQQKLESELLTLMESARRGGLSDLLEIEREVARVRGEIESMQGRMRYLADQSALSTLTVELREPAALVDVEPGAMDPIFAALGDAVGLFAKSLGAIIVFVAVIFPWVFAAWVLIRLGLWWWRRRARRRE